MGSEMCIRDRAYDLRVFDSAPLDRNIGGLTLIDRLEPNDPANTNLLSRSNYSCGNGGTISEIVERPGINDRRHTLVYTNCVILGELINGFVEYYTSSFGDHTYRFEDYTVEFAPEGMMLLDGTISQSSNNRAPRDVVRNDVSTSSFDYFISFSDRRLAVNTAATDYDYLVSRACCSLADSTTRRIIPTASNESFTMTPPGETSSFVVEVVTPLSASGVGQNIFFNQGQIRVTSTSDGSTLLFDAGGGDNSSAMITLGNATFGTAYPWQTWADIFQACCR